MSILTIVAIFCSAIKNDNPPLIYEDGNQRRDFIHVKDLVRGKLLLLNRPEADYGIFNIGTGKPTSIIELAETLIELCGKTFNPDVIYKFRNGDIRDCYADISKIKRQLKWKPKISFEEGVSQLLDNIDYWRSAPLWNVSKIKIATNAKKNSGIDTPAIPATVSPLSVADPFFKALKIPKEQPKIVDIIRATIESSSVAGIVLTIISFIATPPAIE